MTRHLKHWLRLAYGGFCHAAWMALPDRLAFGTALGDHLLGWAGYYAHITWRTPNL